MIYVKEYHSPIGDMLIIGNDECVTDLVFKNQEDYKSRIPKEYVSGSNDVIDKMVKWLDLYFIGIQPDFEAPLGSGVRWG